MSKKERVIDLKNKNLLIGILLICVAATFNSLSQLVWKLSDGHELEMLWYIFGFVLSGIGMLVMMVAFRFGEVSILQPMMSVGFALSIFLGWIFLQEPLTITKIIGTALIIIGAAILGKSEEKEAAK